GWYPRSGDGTLLCPAQLSGTADSVAADGLIGINSTHPWSDGTTGIRLSPVELLEKLAALVPLPHVHLVRSGGCLAPHSPLRGSVIPPRASRGWSNRRP